MATSSIRIFIAGLACLLIGQSVWSDEPKGAVLAPLASGQERVIFDNSNVGGEFNGPSAPTLLTCQQSCLITYLETYHWNSGQGKAPGTISLRQQDGTVLSGRGTPSQLIVRIGAFTTPAYSATFDDRWLWH